MDEDEVTRGQAPLGRSGHIGASFGGYEVEGELGRGGMGVVYRARQTTLNRQVALKMLTGHFGEEELRRFLAESQTAALLHHSNIVHIYEIGELENIPYFSMELVEGGSLADKLRLGLPTVRESAQLLATIARALHFAHQNGVVHRDMKPANILLDPEGVPKIADFGIAKRMDGDHAMTLSGAVIGTPTYMAPEQAGGTSKNVGPLADVYAMGAILYEMLTGRPPFLPEESETALTLRILDEETTSPAWHRPEISREIEIICMKCLQKDPRDRYASAAALAEDLRRFLDDEGILARPPSKTVRTFKWVRRHPWGFAARAAVAAALILGSWRAWQWEFHERLRTEYAASVDYVNGGLEPVLRIDQAEAGKRAVSLKLTRRGRSGPVVQVEVINSRGHPAVLRRVVMPEAILIYIEGILGAHPYSEKLPETTRVEFHHEGDVLREAIGHDRTGSVNWRILYDREIQASGGTGIGHGRFVNLRGFDPKSLVEATHMEFARDAGGRDVRVTFFNAGGRPAANGEGVFGYRFERDKEGRALRLFNLGRDGQPAANRAGLVGIAQAWNDKGQVDRVSFLDGAGQATTLSGVSALTADYDPWGNVIRLRRLGPDGEVVTGKNFDWSVEETERNERGEMIGRVFWKIGRDGTRTPFSELKVAYDEFGHPAALRYTDSNTRGWALKHDADGNLTEESFLDSEGNPANGDMGYATKRLAYTFGPEGIRREDTFFNASGEKGYWNNSYHRLIDELDPTGWLVRQTSEDYNPETSSFYRHVNEPEWDEQGRSIGGKTRFEDKQGRLATHPDLLYNFNEYQYDENGREIVSWQSGWSVEDFGASLWRIDTTWDEAGVMRRRVEQAYDEQRQPLSVLPVNYPAKIEEEFNDEGVLERKLWSGFDESLCGYHSREVVWAEGELKSVVFRHADGSEVEDMRVMIWLIPENAQPSAAELRVGDQLVSANGRPVSSAYEWTMREEFPGGSIEVLRDGRRLSIEGFDAGKLGIGLEDIGPDVPGK